MDATSIIDGLGKVVGVLTDVMGMVERNIQSIYRIENGINVRRDEQTLQRVLFRLSGLLRYQCRDAMTELAYVIRSSPLKEQTVYAPHEALCEALDRVASSIEEIRQLLSQEHVSLIYRDNQLYNDLFNALRERERILDLLRGKKFDVSVLTSKDIKQIADEYVALIVATEGYERRLAEIIRQERT